MKEFKTKVNEKEFNFRIKEMNGINALSFRTMIMNMDKSVSDSDIAYNTILENVQVQVGNNWVTCKQEDNTFLPEGLENSPKSILDIAYQFLEYVKSFF